MLEKTAQQGLAKHRVLVNHKPPSLCTQAWRQSAFHQARTSAAVLTSAKGLGHGFGQNSIIEQL